MPVFEITLDDGRKLHIDADDDKAALAGVAHFLKQSTPQRSMTEDFVKSMPGGALTHLANMTSSMGEAASHEMSQPEMAATMPSAQEAKALLEQHVTGKMPEPQGRAGRFGAALGGGMIDPSTYMMPGGAMAKLGWGLGSSLGSEGAGQATEAAGGGVVAQQVARLAGNMAGGTASTIPAHLALLRGGRAAAEKAAEAAPAAVSGSLSKSDIMKQAASAVTSAAMSGAMNSMAPGSRLAGTLGKIGLNAIREKYFPKDVTPPEVMPQSPQTPPPMASEPFAPGAPWGARPTQTTPEIPMPFPADNARGYLDTRLAEMRALARANAAKEQQAATQSKAQDKQTMLAAMPLIQRLAAQEKLKQQASAQQTPQAPPEPPAPPPTPPMNTPVSPMDTPFNGVLPRDIASSSKALMRGVMQVEKMRQQALASTQGVAQQPPPAPMPLPASSPGIISNIRPTPQQPPMAPPTQPPVSPVIAAQQAMAKAKAMSPQTQAPPMDAGIPDFLRRNNPTAQPSPVEAVKALTKVNGVVKTEPTNNAPAALTPQQQRAADRAAIQDKVNTVYSQDDARSMDLLPHTSKDMGADEAAAHAADWMQDHNRPFKHSRDDFIGSVSPVIQSKDQLAERLSQETGIPLDKLLQHVRAIATRAQAKEWREALQHFEPTKASRIADVFSDSRIARTWLSPGVRR